MVCNFITNVTWPNYIKIHQFDIHLSRIVYIIVAYTMNEIRYKWNDGINSVQISSDASLPHWIVLGHRQKTIEASLSTGSNKMLLLKLRS